MPAYEFRCLTCKKRFERFIAYSDYGSQAVTCPHCGSADVQRRIGRVRIGRTDENRLSAMADPAALDSIDQDPRALGKMMREMSGQIGEDMGPEFHEVVSRLEKGQSPDQIEHDLPDLGGSDSASDDL